MTIPGIVPLVEKKIPYRLIELTACAMTVSDVLAFSKEKLDPTTICKTILIKSKTKVFGILLRGYDRIDFKRVEKLVNEEVSILKTDDVEPLIGIKPGAVCPTILPVPLYVDKRVLELNKINFGSGDHLFGIEMESKDLQRAVTCTIIDVAK